MNNNEQRSLNIGKIIFLLAIFSILAILTTLYIVPYLSFSILN